MAASSVDTHPMRGTPQYIAPLLFQVDGDVHYWFLCGCSGYVLKPEWMRDVNIQDPLPARTPRTLNVHVYSAYRPQVIELLPSARSPEQ